MNYMHRHCRARSKQKRKKLALRAFFKKVFEKRRDKLLKANKPKGRTVVGKAANAAKSIADMYIGTYDYTRMIKGTSISGMNQRQIRKRRRQSPNSKKWAA